MNKYFKQVLSERSSASDKLSYLGENAYYSSEIERSEKLNLLKNALWFISNDEELSEKFINYVKDYEPDLYKAIFKA